MTQDPFSAPDAEEAAIMSRPTREIFIAKVDEKEIAAAFTEWHRRWVEEPGRFQSEASALAEPDDDYGQGAMRYFIKVFRELVYGTAEVGVPLEQPPE